MASGLDQQRSLTGWLRCLEEFLEQDPWEMEQRIRKIPDEEWEIARVDLAGWRALHATVHGWPQALESWRPDEATRFDAEGFLARYHSVLSGDAALWTVMKRGVQVLEGLAAAYRPFEHVFLVEMEAGTFPSRRPVSPILHREDREALQAVGLPLALDPTWEERERALFRALRAGARNLTLSHATLDPEGREQVGSVFLDEVLAENIRPIRRIQPDPGHRVVCREMIQQYAVVA